MKRLFAFIIAALMLCLISVPVFADEGVVTGNTYTLVDEGYGTMVLTIVDESKCNMSIIFENGDIAEVSGTYTLDGNIITIASAGEELGTLEIIGNTLVIYEEPEVSVAPETIPDAESSTAEDHTFATRVWEFVKKNKNTVFEVGFSTVILVLLWFVKKAQSKLKNDLSLSNSNSVSVANSQSGVIGAVNTMIEGYNTFKSDFTKIKEADAERDKQIAAMIVTNTAILDIMSRVFPNSKTLPQGVKDMVNITYANTMKAINDDQQLTALVEASRILLAAGTEKAASEEEAV